MSIDDLFAVAVAIQQDVRHQTDKMIELMEHPKGPGGPAPTAPTPDPFLDRVASVLGKVASASAAAQLGLNAFISTFDRVIGAMGGGMARFVQLANPGVVMQFNFALENAMAAIGGVLAPVMARFAVMIQQMANAIESLSPLA